MTTPGQPSGTSIWSLSDAQIVLEAADRIRVRPAAIDRHFLLSASTSLNLEMRSIDIRGGPATWKIVSGTINLVQGQAVYTLPTNLVTLTELWYSTVNGNGAGINSDRIMVPLTRTQYAMLPNKLQQGQPTQFWYQGYPTPQITIWETPFAPAPAYVLNYFALQRIQDANLGSGETPDVVFRGLEALCAGLALRLADKFMDPSLMEIMMPRLEKQATDAWNEFASQDQDMGPMLIQPNVGGYGRIS